MRIFESERQITGNFQTTNTNLIMKVWGEFSGRDIFRSLSFFDVIMMLSEWRQKRQKISLMKQTKGKKNLNIIIFYI